MRASIWCENGQQCSYIFKAVCWCMEKNMDRITHCDAFFLSLSYLGSLCIKGSTFLRKLGSCMHYNQVEDGERERERERGREANTFRLPIEYEQKREEEEVVPSSLPSLRYENVSVILTHAVEHQQPHPPLQTNTATFCVSMKMCVILRSLSLTNTHTHTRSRAHTKVAVFLQSLYNVRKPERKERAFCACEEWACSGYNTPLVHLASLRFTFS